MRRREPLLFLDATAQRFVEEGRQAYQQLELGSRLMLDQGSDVLLLTWLGDSANEALACLMMSRGFVASAGRLGVELNKSGRTLDQMEDALADAASESPPPVDDMLAKAGNLGRQKWDGLLSPHLLRVSYASLNLNMDEVAVWLKSELADLPN